MPVTSLFVLFVFNCFLFRINSLRLLFILSRRLSRIPRVLPYLIRVLRCDAFCAGKKKFLFERFLIFHSQPLGAFSTSIFNFFFYHFHFLHPLLLSFWQTFASWDVSLTATSTVSYIVSLLYFFPVSYFPRYYLFFLFQRWILLLPSPTNSLPLPFPPLPTARSTFTPQPFSFVSGAWRVIYRCFYIQTCGKLRKKNNSFYRETNCSIIYNFDFETDLRRWKSFARIYIYKYIFLYVLCTYNCFFNGGVEKNWKFFPCFWDLLTF